MPSQEPPAGQQPNPYGPPPGSTRPASGPSRPWGPPPGSPTGFQGPPSGPPTHAPWQPAPQPPRGRRNAIIALVAVLVLLVAGGGAAWALLDRDGDDANQAEGQESSDVSTPPSSVDTSPSEPTTPSTSPGSGGGDAGSDSEPTPRTLSGYVQADNFRNDWEFRWDDHAYNARSVVARDHLDCSEIASDGRLDELGCNRAVSATYVNERDQVTITHLYLKFGEPGLAAKQATRKARAVAELKDLDQYLTLEGDAVWEGWEQGGWRADWVEGIVIFTGVTAPADADAETVDAYLNWSHTDFKEGLRIRRAF